MLACAGVCWTLDGGGGRRWLSPILKQGLTILSLHRCLTVLYGTSGSLGVWEVQPWGA